MATLIIMGSKNSRVLGNALKPVYQKILTIISNKQKKGQMTNRVTRKIQKLSFYLINKSI